MNLMRWERFKDADEYFRNFSPFFGAWPRMFEEDGGNRIEWSPAADISETDKEFLVKAELPGVKREDVKVTLEDGVLTIQGERKLEKEEKGERSHRRECFYGSFCRSFTLPDNVDVSGVRADNKEGVLNVHVPKLRIEKPKALEIKIQ